MTVAAPSVFVISTNATPGMIAELPIAFATDTNCSSAEFDLMFNPTYLTPGVPSGGNALADHFIISSLISSGTIRVQINSFSNALLKNGVLVYIPFTISSNEVNSSEPMTLTNVILSNPQVPQISPVFIYNGAISLNFPLRFNSIGVTNGVAHLNLQGTAGADYIIQVATNPVSSQWISIYTNSANGNGVLQYNDNAIAGGAKAKYYRALQTN